MTDQYRYDPKAQRPSAILETSIFHDVINAPRPQGAARAALLPADLTSQRPSQPRASDGQPTGSNIYWRHPARVIFAIGLLVYALSGGHLNEALNWLLALLN